MPEAGASGAISIREFDVAQRRELSVQTVGAAVGSAISVGREAELPLGVAPLDAGISRVALTVTLADGWQIVVRNRNGAVLHPWGQAPVWVDGQTDLKSSWPRIGMRLVGSVRSLEHWVLLQTIDNPLPPRDRASQVPGPTRQPDLPRPLTGPQIAAVHTVFREFLAWPPISSAAPMPIASAANRLRISPTAVNERLWRVQERAYVLGLHQQTGVSDPEYIYLLVRHGYIAHQTHIERPP